MKRIFGAFCAAATALLVAGVAGAVAGGRATDGTTAGGGVDASSAIVVLKGDPLSTFAATRPAPGKKINFDSNTVKSYRAQLAAERNDFKQWLKQNAPAARITGQFDIGLNAVAVQLNGTSLDSIRAAPMVVDAQYEELYTPQVTDPDLSLINAFGAWAAGGGSANAGKEPDGTRVRIAIVDTGIDQTHPCFNDTGYAYPLGFPKGDTTYTNKKVIVAKVFNIHAKRLGLTPAPLQEHGTHVAGTAACDYGLTNSTTTVDGTPVGYGVLGVAPQAQLGNYNVFPDNVTDARSEDIFQALEAAYADGMDVANMSLGDPYTGTKDLLAAEVNNLDKADMVVAIAAGNSGPGLNTIQDPGAAARGLTAGAVTVGHFIGVNVTVGATNYPAAVGQFGPTAPATGALAVLGTNLACSVLTGGSLTGDIALIRRGSCTFSTKIRNAQDAGAVGVVVVNNVFGPPSAMAQDGTPNQPTIPGVMVSRSLRTTLEGLGGTATTINDTRTYVQSLADNDYLAGFSSRGPTNVDFRIKPDVTAPGVNVLSSIPAAFCAAPPCWAFFQGTSMATPHLAGSAAVVIGQHPSWAAWEVRSAIVNTADQTVKDPSTAGALTDVNAVGAGRENLNSAVHASLALDPVSVSFGAIPTGSGQTRSMDVTVANLTGSTVAFTPSITPGDATVHYSVSSNVFSIPAGGTAKVTVTVNLDKGATLGAHQATLSLGTLAHAAVVTWVK